jgi:hypothetical protein
MHIFYQTLDVDLPRSNAEKAAAKQINTQQTQDKVKRTILNTAKLHTNSVATLIAQFIPK